MIGVPYGTNGQFPLICGEIAGSYFTVCIFPGDDILLAMTLRFIESHYSDQRKHQSSASLAFVWGIHRDRWIPRTQRASHHNIDVIMTTMASRITSLTVVYSNVYSDADQRKHESSASLAFVWGIHRTGEFPAQRASCAENVAIWWRHHGERRSTNTAISIDCYRHCIF